MHGDQVIAEYDDSGTEGVFLQVRKFIYGTCIDEPVAMTVEKYCYDMFGDMSITGDDREIKKGS